MRGPKWDSIKKNIFGKSFCAVCAVLRNISSSSLSIPGFKEASDKPSARALRSFLDGFSLGSCCVSEGRSFSFSARLSTHTCSCRSLSSATRYLRSPVRLRLRSCSCSRSVAAAGDEELSIDCPGDGFFTICSPVKLLLRCGNKGQGGQERHRLFGSRFPRPSRFRLSYLRSVFGSTSFLVSQPVRLRMGCGLCRILRHSALRARLSP